MCPPPHLLALNGSMLKSANTFIGVDTIMCPPYHLLALNGSMLKSANTFTGIDTMTCLPQSWGWISRIPQSLCVSGKWYHLADHVSDHSPGFSLLVLPASNAPAKDSVSWALRWSYFNDSLGSVFVALYLTARPPGFKFSHSEFGELGHWDDHILTIL
jgi:hypothetical protein